jgi:exosome complex component RRP4
LRQIILPGEVILDSEQRIPYTFAENGKTYSCVTGTLDKMSGRLVPLEGIWAPRRGDVVVGVVTSAGRKGMFILSLSHFMTGMLIDKYPRFEIKVGDILEAEVDKIENKRIVHVWRPKLLEGGMLLTIGAPKVHRVIGKNNTMIRQISEMTRCSIVVGENGMVWLKGENMALAAAAISQVDRAAHVSGLTEFIKNMLIENKKGK